jgi:hypothetical protein
MRSSRVAILAVGVALTAAAIAAWLFPRAFPTIALKQSLTRDAALARADSFFRAHSLAPAGARTAVRFQGNDSLRTFVELAGGGHDSLNALVRGKDVAPFAWSVRAFVPGNPREARVHFAPDGRIIGFERKLADADQRPTISADSGQRLAEQALRTWTMIAPAAGSLPSRPTKRRTRAGESTAPTPSSAAIGASAAPQSAPKSVSRAILQRASDLTWRFPNPFGAVTPRCGRGTTCSRSSRVSEYSA